jgi:methylated-DNA-[protein]-cysteine S-methyltransferase
MSQRIDFRILNVMKGWKNMLLETPFGPIHAACNDAGALTELKFGNGSSDVAGSVDSAVAVQLNEYFLGKRHTFSLDLSPDGTEFQRQIWAELMRIPYGETISYSELARRVGREGAARAVGRANATNPIAIVVPCHRVIGADGSLTGYAYGVELKRRLLDFERGQCRL